MQYLLVAALALAYVVAVVRRRRSIAIMLKCRSEGSSPFDAVLLAIPVMVIIYGASKWAWVYTEPRYLFAFSPVLVWCLAAALPQRPRPVRTVAVVIGVSVFTVTSITALANRPFGGSASPLRDVQAASDYLRGHGEVNGYGDYWTAMPLLYAGAGEINVAPFISGRTKFPEVNATVDAADDIFYVAAGPHLAAKYGGLWLEQALKDHHVTYQKSVFGNIVVLDHLSPTLKPWELKIGSKPPA